MQATVLNWKRLQICLMPSFSRYVFSILPCTLVLLFSSSEDSDAVHLPQTHRSLSFPSSCSPHLIDHSTISVRSVPGLGVVIPLLNDIAATLLLRRCSFKICLLVHRRLRLSSMPHNGFISIDSWRHQMNFWMILSRAIPVVDDCRSIICEITHRMCFPMCLFYVKQRVALKRLCRWNFFSREEVCSMVGAAKSVHHSSPHIWRVFSVFYVDSRCSTLFSLIFASRYSSNREIKSPLHCSYLSLEQLMTKLKAHGDACVFCCLRNNRHSASHIVDVGFKIFPHHYLFL